MALGPTSVGLGLVAHLASGGASPPVAVLIALTALVSLLGASTGRLTLPGWAVGVASAGIQQLLHLAFTGLSGANAPLLPSAGHHHGGPPLPAATAGVAASQPDMHLMVVAHVAAALVTAFVVARSLAWADQVSRRRGGAGRLEGYRVEGDGASADAEIAPSRVEQVPLSRTGREPRGLTVFLRGLVRAP